MSFLLDTNVISELIKPSPDETVVGWLDETDEDRLFLSAVTLAEVFRGIERLPHGRRRRSLDEWLRDDMLVRFEGRLLPIDLAVAEAWGQVTAQCEVAGRPIGILDAFIAATARVHGLQLATRNVKDFEATEVPTVNPWKGD